MRLGILLISLILLAGCGGDDAVEQSGPLNRAEYTRLANEICETADRKLAEIGDFESFEQLSEQMKVGEAALRTSVRDLRALEPPQKLVADHKVLIDLQAQTADVARRISAAAKENNQIEMQTQAQRADELTRSANETARRLGLDDCVAG